MYERFVARDDFGHLGFDGGEVFRGEGSLAVEVVKEAGVGGGAVAELGLGEELENGGGEDVSGGVAHDFEGFGILLGEERERGVFGERSAEIDETRGCGVLGRVHGGFSGLGDVVIGVLAAAVTAVSGVRRAAMEAAASRGEMEFAISNGVVPEGTSRMAPSGSVTEMVCLLMSGFLNFCEGVITNFAVLIG